MTGLTELLQRLQDELARTPTDPDRRPMVVLTEDHHGLVTQGDAYAAPQLLTELQTRNVDVDMVVVCHPADARFITAMFESWTWLVVTDHELPVKVRPYAHPAGAALLGERTPLKAHSPTIVEPDLRWLLPILVVLAWLLVMVIGYAWRTAGWWPWT